MFLNLENFGDFFIFSKYSVSFKYQKIALLSYEIAGLLVWLALARHLW